MSVNKVKEKSLKDKLISVNGQVKQILENYSVGKRGEEDLISDIFNIYNGIEVNQTEINFRWFITLKNFLIQDKSPKDKLLAIRKLLELDGVKT